MAIAADTIWDFRTTGSSTNGGGFAASYGGTDYSQQDSPQLTHSDGIIYNATNTVLHSATGGFTAAMVGNAVYLSTAAAGARFIIVAYTDTNTVTLDRAAVAGDTTNITFCVGGSILILNAALDSFYEGLPAGNICYWRGVNPGTSARETYTLSANVSISSSAATYTLPITVVEGYYQTHGDRPTTQAHMPKIDHGAYSWVIGNYKIERNCEHTSTTTYTTSAGYSYRQDLIVSNTSSTNSRIAVYDSAASRARRCQISAPYAIAWQGNHSSAVEECWIHDSYIGLNIGSSAAQLHLSNLVENCETGLSISSATYPAVRGITIFGCSSGIVATSTSVYSNYLNSIISYCKVGANWSGGTNYGINRWDYNNWYGNTSDVAYVTKGDHDTAYDPAFQGFAALDAVYVDHSNNKVVKRAAGGFSSHFQALDRIKIAAAASWTEGTYVVVSVDSDTQMTLAASPAAVDTTGGVIQTIRTAPGVADARLGSASSCRGAGIGLALGVGAASTVEQGAWQAGAGSGGSGGGSPIIGSVIVRGAA